MVRGILIAGEKIILALPAIPLYIRTRSDMATKEKILRITILREGGSYVALCPELGVKARAETKEEAKARVADMINASLGPPLGGDESLSPPTPSPRSFWKIFRVG